MFLRRKQAKRGPSLRQRAEDQVMLEMSISSGQAVHESHEDNLRLLQELRVHQIELEMQNEELCQTQLELEAAKNRYFDLYDMAPVGYCTLDEQGRILEANITASNMFGLTRGALTGQLIHRFIFNEDQNFYYLQNKKSFTSGERREFDLRMIRNDGTIFWVNIVTTLEENITEKSKRYKEHLAKTRIIINDISERKRAEEERHKLEERLNRTNALEALGVLAAGVAHNLNNVLAVIMGTASMHDLLANDPVSRDFKIIDAACMRGRSIIRSLIQFAKPSIYNQSPCELHMLIREICTLLENTTLNRIKIVKIFAHEPLWIKGDAGSINHALLNLALNSLDAMPEKGTLTLRTTTLEGDWVELSIEDNGSGMTPEVMSHAFEPFFTTKEVGQGTGLGLSMAYGVMKAHGGTLEIASHPGQGTSVKLRFPRIPAPVTNEIVNTPTPSLASMNVYLVGDDEDVRFLMPRILKQAGVLQVKTFPGGEAVLEALHSGEVPDLIILDQNMPGLNGIQTMERIRDQHPEMPILISSGQPGIADWDCFKQPKFGVIPKPFTMEEILAKLGQFAHGS